MARPKTANRRIQTTMRFDKDLLKRLSIIAKVAGRTRSNFIETEMWNVVKREEKKLKQANNVLG